jgi:hypothetical protein
VKPRFIVFIGSPEKERWIRETIDAISDHRNGTMDTGTIDRGFTVYDTQEATVGIACLTAEHRLAAWVLENKAI